MGWFKNKLDGVRFTLFSTGRMFDPTDQKRTCPLKDIAKSKEKSVGSLSEKKIIESFGIPEEEIKRKEN